MFVDPIADIAVLGAPDNQSLIDEADAYGALVDATRPLAIADAPAQTDRLRPGKGEARVLSLDGNSRDGHVERWSMRLAFSPKNTIESGMSARRSLTRPAEPSASSRLIC